MVKLEKNIFGELLWKEAGSQVSHLMEALFAQYAKQPFYSSSPYEEMMMKLFPEYTRQF